MKIVMTSLVFALTTFAAFAQGGSARVAYIDMEYILKRTPEYIEATMQLENKANQWSNEVETKKTAIKKLKDELSSERVLLTRELIEEKEEAIGLLENKLLDYQQKRFGTQGDLITQKVMLAKPIQDQVFAVIQDIAEAKKYDYVLDKSSETTMLVATKRHDISDQVIQRMVRARRRQNMPGKQVEALEEQDKQRDIADLRRERREEQERLKKAFNQAQKEEKAISDPGATSKDQATSKQEEALAEAKRKQEALENEKKRALQELKEKQALLEEQKQERIEQQKRELADKQKQIEEQKRLAAEQRKLLQEEKLREIQVQKETAEAERLRRQEKLEREKQERLQAAQNTNKGSEKLDIEKLKEERRLFLEQKQAEIQKKKEEALKARQEQIEAVKKAQEERRQRILKEQEEKRKELQRKKEALLKGK